MAEGASAGAEAIWESGEFEGVQNSRKSEAAATATEVSASRAVLASFGCKKPPQAFCRKGKVFWIQEAAAGVDFLDGHFVLGEGAGFLSEQMMLTQPMVSWQAINLFDQSVFAGHFDDVEGEGDGDDGGQAFRHGGHDEDDAGDEGF